MKIKYKTLFYYFLSCSLSITMLAVLDVLGFGKCGYYTGGAVYACLHFVTDRATIGWRKR